MSQADSDYINVKIPKPLSDEVDKLVELRVKGYRSRSEFVIQAIREFLEDFEEDLKPRLEHFNVYEDHVTVWDRVKRRLVDVYFRGEKPYVFCSLCEVADCEHTRFALSLPEIAKELQNRGWRIQEGKVTHVPL